MRAHWQNPEVTGYGREPAHATFKHDRRDVQYLTGTWDFARFPHPDKTPDNWTEIDWQETQVPSLWTMDPRQPDKPIYTNVKMPFRAEPPLTPPLNPTAIYRRNVVVESSWLKDRVVLQVGGVESCYYLYCNGTEVGFAKDARLPSEFDLTDHLKPGDNEIALKVIRYSDASYIEDQDQWRHAGIHRELFLYRTPHVFLQDVFAKPAFDPETGKGQLSVVVRLGEENRSTLHHRVEIQLFDHNNRPVFRQAAFETVEKNQFYAVTGKGPLLQIDTAARKVRSWTAETPHLYRLEVTLFDDQGATLQSVILHIGFRDIRIDDRQLLVNGQAVLIRGVNRHDHSDTTGKVMTEDLIRQDIITMKQHNINAVRTSHYPNDPMFYQLCDELGMYVVDEANVEAHHHYARLGAEPEWSGQFLNRGMRMVERDKNHPCIIMWSAGNETGFGPNHMAMTAWIREYDPSRPIHNENAICEQRIRDMWDENHHGTDVVCPMYPSVDEIIAHARDSDDPRPLIMCEYAHAMGNSCGNLKEYWEAVETWHGLQGGFIWEWLDHGIQSNANGIPYWAYGGDFGEEQHDLNFVCDGLCWPDRTPHSSLLEYKKVIQPVTVSHLGARRFTVTNKDHFTDLGLYRGSWSLLINGEVVKSGKLPAFRTPAQYAEDFEIKLPEKLPAGERSIIFEFRLKQAKPWADQGHLVAWDQISLGGKRPATKFSKAKASVDQTGDALSVSCSGTEFHFDNEQLRSINIDGISIETPLLLNFWRAPMDNDGIKGWSGQDGKALGIWRDQGLDTINWTHQIKKASATSSGYLVQQLSKGACVAGAILVDSRFVFAENSVSVSHRFSVPKSFKDLPRVGVRWQLPAGLEQLSWYGRGPHETYSDRLLSGQLRVHQSTVTDQYVPYILPQEHGNLTGTRWLKLSSDSANLLIDAPSPIEASASHYSQEQLTPAFHTYEISPEPFTYLCLDISQRGVGGASCGPDTLPQYRMDPGEYELNYRIDINHDQSG